MLKEWSRNFNIVQRQNGLALAWVKIAHVKMKC